MTSRQDQLHAYQFQLQRVISALIVGETDPAQAPLRRGVGAAFAGLMVAAVVLAGFGVYGIFTGVGSASWRTDGAVVVEKESGASYVYSGGVLHPMLNYTSALLASGQDPPQTYRVAAVQLADVRRGAVLGIPGAPTSLPAATDAVKGPWTLCSQETLDGAGDQLATTSMVVGETPPGGIPIGDNGLLTRDTRSGDTYLIWRVHRYLIERPQALVPALFGAQNTVLPVGTAWLDALPAGADIAPVSVPGQGIPASALPGSSVGDIVYDQTGRGPQYYLVLRDGLAPISELQMHVQATGTTPPRQVSAGAVSNAPESTVPGQGQVGADSQPPTRAPELAAPAGGAASSLCATVPGSGSAPALSLGADLSRLGGGIDTESPSSVGTSLVDRMIVRPGRIAVVMAMVSPTATNGAASLITDTGLRFPLSSPGILAALGYPSTVATRMPASLLSRIPTGPTLDPAAALRRVPAGSTS